MDKEREELLDARVAARVLMKAAEDARKAFLSGGFASYRPADANRAILEDIGRMEAYLSYFAADNLGIDI